MAFKTNKNTFQKLAALCSALDISFAVILQGATLRQQGAGVSSASVHGARYSERF